MRDAAYFESLVDGTDPALVREAADRVATLLVRGARSSDDAGVADRVLRLAEEEGLETLADLWAGAPADSLAGCLWRLYLLRSWVYADPEGVARQFEAGRARAHVARVVAGVAEPPGPAELRGMIDEVLRGIAERDFADVLIRAGAFAHVIAMGRASVPGTSNQDALRVLNLAEQLEHAARLELSHSLA